LAKIAIDSNSLKKITYFIDDKLGGVSSLNLNLIKHAPADVCQEVIGIVESNGSLSKANIKYPVEKQVEFINHQSHNEYTIIKKLRSLIQNEEGALILNYGTEMAMLDHYSVSQTTFQLVHDEYNLRLAKEFGHVVDVFICHNAFIEEQLLSMYPTRKNDIFFLSHGVEIPGFYRFQLRENSPLRLLFLGRFSKSKGIFDLPKIAEILRLKNVPVTWTCIGAGPEENDFKTSWHKLDEVEFLSPKTNAEVIQIASQHDVFVLPTKFEGTPVSLLETMSVGLVPVITSLNGGIQEIVSTDIGYALPIDDNDAFANAIIQLHENRHKLETLSNSCRQKIIDDFNLENTAKSYFSLFLNYANFKKEKKIKKRKLGSTLDQPFLPNFFTRLLRMLMS
jgi:glycosyltransferase involved in cell wall biosynthesis